MNDSLNAAAARAFNLNRLAPPEPAVYLHCAIFLDRNTTLGAETFRLQSFQGQEQVSGLFEFQLELNGNSDGEHAAVFSFNDIIGRPITVGIEIPSAGTADPASFDKALAGAATAANATPALSLFHGMVSSFSVKNRGSYSITMTPDLHRLQLTNSYRVFHGKTVWNMITTLLDGHNIAYAPFSAGQDNLALNRSQDWMQAGETDYEFLMRLLGKAHLHYYFTHTGNSHTVVFSNQNTYPQVFADGRALPYDFTSAQPLGATKADVVTDYSLKKSLGSTGVHGVLTQHDGAWLDNRVVDYHSFQGASSADADTLPFHLYKTYQYGCSKDEARAFADATKSTLDSSRHELSGSSTCSHFRAAHRFAMRNLSGGPENPRQPCLEEGDFVLTSVKHQVDADGNYQNQFQASAADFLITPYSIQDTQQGSVLALVVSDAVTPGQNPVDFGAASSFSTGQTNFTDSLATPSSFPQIGVYVKFSTDDKDAPAVWIKLSSSMQTAPTVGSVVSVGRAQDESELPEIQNVVQSNGTTLVVPSGWLSNTHIGSNFSTGYGDNQNISYGKYSVPDLKQSSGIVKNAYDTGRFGNSSFSQGAGYSFSCAESTAAGAQSDSGELYGSDAVAADILSASESFGSTYSRAQGSMSYSHTHFTKSENNSWTGDSVSSSYVDSSSSTSHVNTSTSTSYTGNSLSASAGLTSTSTSVMGMAANNSNTGVSINVTTMGSSVNTNVTGSVVNSSLTGSTLDVSLSGDTVRNSTSGDLVETTTTGNTIRTSTSGNLTETITSGTTERTITTGLTTEDHVGCGKTINKVDGEVVSNETNASVVENVSSGDSTRIVTTAASSHIVTNAETTTVETSGPGARVSNSDETPHVDNIVTRVCMVEASIIFM